jgi:hypothetical protein
MATKAFCTEWVTFHVPVPAGRLTRRSIDEAVAMAASRLTWELYRRRQAQAAERVRARAAKAEAAKGLA